MKHGNTIVWVALLGVLAIAVFALAPFVGMTRIPLASVMAAAETQLEHKIFWEIRVPRVCVAFLAGAALSASGMCFQALFRNPLATPFTLGVSSGASLGAALYVNSGLMVSLWCFPGVTLFAFAGAIGAISLVYGLTRLRRGFSTYTMLLAGVAVSFFFSSLILFLQFISDMANSFRIIRWLMGGVETAGFQSVWTVLPFVAVGIGIVICHINELNLLTVGEDFAVSRGVNLQRVKKVLFFGTSLMVGGVVAACGPIGFVGMICPHICRLLVGSNHRYLAPASILFGGTFLVICDTVARTLIAPAEMPVGVLTALLGGPFFLWLLVRGAGLRANH